MTRSLTLIVCLATAAAWTATAQPRPEGREGGPPGGEHFAGRVFISPSGEPFRGPDGLVAWFEGADTDHDGSLSLSEFRADAVRFFKRVDADGDGRIDGFENQAYETDIAPEITRLGFADEGEGPGRFYEKGLPDRNDRGPGFFGGRGGRREGAARYALLNEPQPISGADADLDGRITLKEWLKSTDQRFALLDPKSTGKLTLEDLRKLKAPDPGPREKRGRGGRR